MVGTGSARTRETSSAAGFAYKDGGRNLTPDPRGWSKFLLHLGLNCYPEIQIRW